MGPPHMCPTGCKLKSSMAGQEWVEKHALAMLMKNPAESAKAIQLKLTADYNVDLPYHTVWKGKERALKILYGALKIPYQQIFLWPLNLVLMDSRRVVGHI